MKSYRALLLVGVALAFCSGIYAATIHVPADQPTIQTGINAAVDGDTVLVAPGTYEPVVISKPLTLLSSGGSEKTIIQGRPSYRCVYIYSVTDTVTVRGFSLEGAVVGTSSLPPFGRGAGLLATASNVKIDNCFVSGNRSGGAGGGMAFCDSTYFEISDSRIRRNGSYASSGGGILAVDAKGCKIYNTVIDSNEAYLNGGGVFIYSSSVNPAMSFEVKNCVIAGNTAYEYGMGIGVRRNNLSISSCIIYANHAAAGATNPFGIYVSAGSLSLHCSDLYMNDQANLFADNITDSSANINADPLFCDPTAGNFHISRCSPCVPNSNGCGGSIGSASAGCDSGCPPSSLTWHVAIDGSDLTGNGTSAYPFATIQRGIDISEDGDTVLVAPGTYSGIGNRNLHTNGKRIAVKSTEGSDSTILDCEGDSSAFRITFSEDDTSTVIEGFTITNAINGMVLEGYAPRIQDMNIERNTKDGIVVSPGFGRYTVINRCEFIENGHSGISSFTGSANEMIVEDCVFTDNGDWGISHEASGSLSCKRSIFTGNPTAIISPDKKTIIEVDSCIFENNQTALDGGFVVSNSVIRNGVKGIQGGGGCSSGWVLEYHFSNCLFEGITGVVLEATGGPTELYKCTIRNNPGVIASSTLMCYDDCWYGLVFTDCAIEGNGGGITVGYCTHLSLTRCIYAWNGGGIDYHSNPIFGRSLQVVSCTIADNLSNGIVLSPSWGNAFPSHVQNTLIANNGGVGFVYEAKDSNMLVFSCNDVFDNQQGDYLGISDQTGINGNIALDPRFCDTANGNFQILQSSPCAPGNNSCGVLIGALGIGCFEGDVDGDSTVNIADVVFLIDYIFMGGAAPLPLSVGDVDCSGSINIADVVYLIAYIFSGGPAPCGEF
ncbi:MAG: right-handed parallel beta-helix repeat-containing protein [candidate division Zixibacteria bacterium]|nr:right-handed parallel beta-helix repeat-containing protein [candidate division Zixibacteria bacterium]